MNLKDLKEFVVWLAGWWVIGHIILAAISWLPFGRDSTDPPWPSRSGLSVFKDEWSGCEYLATSKGHLTPRMDTKGYHAGCTFINQGK